MSNTLKAVNDVASNRPGTSPGIGMDSVLNSLAAVVTVIDPKGQIAYVNNAGEQFFKSSSASLIGKRIDGLIPKDSPMMGLIDQARAVGAHVSEYGVALETPRIGTHFVNIHAGPVVEQPEMVVLVLQERSIADTIDRQLTHRGAARSVSAMAAMLAHEVKNPLSGIRGAAQLLEQSVDPQDRAMTQLIRDETDRIVALVDRMDIFSDGGPLQRSAVNIHQVLDRVRKLAENGFARHVRFVENYDPSLPPVLGERDQLVQVFLNLIKNAAEAISKDKGGEIIISTSYRHGIRFAVSGNDSKVHLPLIISVQDNGEGIAEDIQGYLFDAFVTSKPKGSGLGLALVAKIVGEHGGIIEFDSQPNRTIFKIMLPIDTEIAGQAPATEEMP